VSATLRVEREHGGVELRRGPFEIVLDGTSVGSIVRHQTVEVPVEPGGHTVQVRTGRYTSKAEGFVIADGDTVTFRCHGAVFWPRYVASILVPSLALPLTRQ